ncbi:MAG: hypothetical protein SAMD01599839_10670 [Rectinema sp.]
MRPIQRYFNAYRGLPSSLYVLFGATVINSVGMFVFPFLTLYLTGRLGMSQKEAGLFIMIVNFAYIPANFIGGKIADTFGRKKLMVTAQVLSGLCYIPCGFPGIGGNVRWFLLASVFFDGLTDPARTAMMTDLTTPETRRPAFSLTYLGHNLGFAVGMMIAGFLFEKATSWLFWGNAIAILAAIRVIYGTLMTLNATMVIVLSTPIMTLTQHWKPINAVALAGPLLGGFGWSISPPLAGAFTDRFGLRTAWPFLGGIAVIASIAIWCLGIIERRPTRKANAATN